MPPAPKRARDKDGDKPLPLLPLPTGLAVIPASSAAEKQVASLRQHHRDLAVAYRKPNGVGSGCLFDVLFHFLSREI